MIAALLSAVFAAAAAGAAPPPPAATPVTPLRVEAPHERAVMGGQFEARPAAAGISATEADRIYALYLGRIGQAAPSNPNGDAPQGGGGGSPAP